MDRLTAALKRHKIRYWYSPSHLVGAQQWHDEIGNALRRCDWFLLVLSPSALRSMWVRREFQYALQAERFQNRIIPVFFLACDPTDLSWTLAAIQSIDFTRDFDHGCRDLFRIWKHKYRPAPSPRALDSRRK